ncbi:MAG: thiamine phosphate synthase [Magnetococcales bacterium]|nr:thiamine phosphate synthase [Magnetococcales bacterium]
MPLSHPRLLLITDSPLPANLVDLVNIALTGAPFDLLLRDKTASEETLCAQAHILIPILHRAGGRLLIHNRLDVAIHVNADGLHLPETGLSTNQARQRLGPAKVLGRSCHAPAHACKHLLDGGDYVTLSPLFATASHPDAMPLGVNRFAAMRAQIPGPVLALGGIDPHNVWKAHAAGASGVALIRGLLHAPNPAQAAKELLAPFGDH